jgi:hypothetical protein
MKYTKGYKYQLHEDEIFYTDIRAGKEIKTQFIELDMDGKLLVKSGYAWDGPSGPTIDRSTNMRGSVAHDALYQLMRNKLLGGAWREKADDYICKCWIEDGMYEWLADIETKALKKYAGFAADPKNAKKIYEAPDKKYLLKRKLDI